MKIFVGLGNPGKKYERTRHNAGFMALDAFAHTNEARSDFFLISREKNAHYEAVEYEQISENKKETIFCVWPQLFMNRSGEAMRDLMRSRKNKMDIEKDLVVLHDDVDIRIGTLKIDRNASAGGHKGVQNIIDQLGTKDFIRFRIGIRQIRKTNDATEDFVLKKFSKEEEKVLTGIYHTTTAALIHFLEDGLAGTQNAFNGK